MLTDTSPPASERITTRLLLVRHGESVATVERRVAGRRTCAGLSPLGYEQAARLADRFAAGHEPDVDALWSSPLPRAMQTAEALDKVLELGISVDDELEEHRPGDADGLRFDDIVARWGQPPTDGVVYEPYLPGGESLAAFQFRIGNAVHALVRAHLGRCVLVACHGGVIDTVFRQFLGLPPRNGVDLWTLNTSITEFAATHDAARSPSRWRLVRYDDAAHLAGLPPETPPAVAPAAEP
ncbi:MAG: histidine phosphatase family protein [Acidimicrobiia bacterium]|nr:histidine phosphatase family protein [Acidimicrobiia bacterium]